uniref:Putative structural protein n=1 Tax=viral metagenome TaxID=1070528 RepID=A0A6M3IYI6_9ZZZZ
MAHLSGKSGSVYIGNYLLSDCEVAWDSGTNGTAALETTIKKVGDGSAKCTIGAGILVGDVIMYDTMAAARDVSTYTHILCWAYSVPTTALLDYRIGLGVTAAGASPTTLVDIPALTAVTWKYCHCTVVSGSPFSATTAGTIIGLESNASGASGDIIYLDDIQAAKTVSGINTWSLDYTSDALESTDFANAGVKAYIVGGSGWSGSFAGYKEGIPLSIGAIYGVELAESATTTEMWLGNIIITGVHPSVGHDGIVSYSYDFTGTGNLTVAST